MNIPAKIVNFIALFYQKRTIQIKNNDILAQSRVTNKGIPHGSVFSPRLYSLYCSSLSLILDKNINILEFSDDVLIHISNKSLDVNERMLNNAISYLSNWAVNGGLDIFLENQQFVYLHVKLIEQRVE